MKPWYTHRSVLLAIAIFFQAEGMLLISMAQQFFHHIEQKEQLEKDHGQFQLLSLSLSTYHRSQVNRHEISVSGEMYDVKSVDMCGDSVNLLVLHDRKEESLLEKLGDYFRNDKPDSKPSPFSLYQLLSEKYIPPVAILITRSRVISKYEFSFLAILQSISIPELPGPPPKF